MPYPYANKLLVWPHSCEKVSFASRMKLEAAMDENCFAQMIAGKALVRHGEKEHMVGVDAVIVLGRSEAISLESVDEHPCQMLLLRLCNTTGQPGEDLNHLCLTAPIVDVFFSLKTRFCILMDREYIRITFSAIEYEMHCREQERDRMIHLLLQEFLIKLARSFHTHEEPTGVQFLSIARAYVRQHFQQELTVGEIAAHAGISCSYLAQLFATHLGYSTVEYIQAVRCDQAAYLLRTTRFPIIDIALEVGFNSRQHFARTFKRTYGKTPNAYRHEQCMNQQQSKTL